jgi:hypothetical protein
MERKTSMRDAKTVRNRTRLLGLGAAAALVFLLAGDGRTQAPPNVGIDPLEILDLQVKPNVLIILDTSGSMKWPTDIDSYSIGADDPASRMFQAKSAVRAVVTANATRFNFGLATYNITDTNKRLNENTDFNGGGADGPFVYVSADANAQFYFDPGNNTAATLPCPDGQGNVDGFFCQLDNTHTNYDGATSAEIFRSFGNDGGQLPDAYPIGCTVGGGVLSPVDVTDPDTMRCRFYLHSRFLRNGIRYTWSQGNNTAATKLLAQAPIPGGCPAPPAGLLGYTSAPPICMQFQQNNGGPVSTFYYTSAIYQLQTGAACGGAALLNQVAACAADNSALVNARMDPELRVAANGTIAGVPQNSATNFRLDYQTPIAGVRADQSTPLAGSLNYVRTAAPAAFLPPAAPGQRNFVILLTDGDDTCADNDTDRAAVLAAEAAEQLWLNTGDPVHQAETLVVAFAAAVSPDRTNVIAQGGSGAIINGGAATPATAVTGCRPGAACRNAFTAQNTQQLVNALNAALASISNTGEFSDQQSITESVFEYVSAVPTPAPPASPAPTPNPMSPETRYAGNVPVLMQSTFEMPGFRGHLNAFRDDGAGNALQLWDAGDKLCQRVTGHRARNTPPPAVCDVNNAGALVDASAMRNQTWTFHEIAWGSSPASGNPTFANNFQPNVAARLRRRIFTTVRNGVFPHVIDGTPPTEAEAGLVPLWPPTFQAGAFGAVDPEDLSFGILDGTATDAVNGPLDRLGLGHLTFAQLQTQYGACQNLVNPSAIRTECQSTALVGVPAVERRLRMARREARQMILAYLAGAEVVRSGSGLPQRFTTPAARVGMIQYRARPWILPESTLSAPAVVSPPLRSSPTSYSREYTAYRDGDLAAGNNAAMLDRGFALRNPDEVGTPSENDALIKPSMSVVYAGSNDMLHAFRAGPCPTAMANCVYGGGGSDTGGEELWGFVPYDQLSKVKLQLQPQTRASKVYVAAAPVRFNDVFVPAPGGAYQENVGGVQFTGRGKWRTIAVFGRGIGGKHMTAIDITTPGQFTRHSLRTNLPTVLWNRGNPDTQNGFAGGPSNHLTNDYPAGTTGTAVDLGVTDLTEYAKMGQTWSVPALSMVDKNLYFGRETVGFVGSGYGATSSEGKTFYVFDLLSGDLLVSRDVPDGAPTFMPNALVASPVSYTTRQLNVKASGNFAGDRATRVYFGDLHGRMWKYVTAVPGSLTRFFEPDDEGFVNEEHPIGTPAALIAIGGTGGVRPHVMYETGRDNRLFEPPASTPPFRMFGLRDDRTDTEATDGATMVFTEPFPDRYRGTVQPTTIFNQNGQGRVFFAGTKFNPIGGAVCVSSFDSVIFALGVETGQAAYDLTSADDKSVTMTGRRVMALSTAFGHLVVDQGLGADTAPPPPRKAEREPTIGGSANVFIRPGSVHSTVRLCN